MTTTTTMAMMEMMMLVMMIFPCYEVWTLWIWDFYYRYFCNNVMLSSYRDIEHMKQNCNFWRPQSARHCESRDLMSRVLRSRDLMLRNEMKAGISVDPDNLHAASSLYLRNDMLVACPAHACNARTDGGVCWAFCIQLPSSWEACPAWNWEIARRIEKIE